jgi:hypothetical protein
MTAPAASPQGPPDQPRISFVFAVRDPEYGGGLLQRTQTNLNALIELANHCRLSAEIVIVEWNPRPDCELFRDLLRWPENLGCVSLRFIEVSPEFHRTLPNADRIPIFEYIAKNVGLRRARGRFLLATNPDLFYSPPLMRWLARAPLASGRFYRVNRYDLSADIPQGLEPAGQHRFCREHIARVHSIFGSYAPRQPGWWSRLRNPDPGRLLRKEYHSHLRKEPRLTAPTNTADAKLLLPADGLHRNAAGDFFLMDRRDWFEMRGYPELYTHSHIDAILCWAAASAGLVQHVLPSRYPLYHQPHNRSDHDGFPQTDWLPWYQQYLEGMRKGNAMAALNDHDWGLAKETFRAWDARPQLVQVVCQAVASGGAG